MIELLKDQLLLLGDMESVTMLEGKIVYFSKRRKASVGAVTSNSKSDKIKKQPKLKAQYLLPFIEKKPLVYAADKGDLLRTVIELAAHKLFIEKATTDDILTEIKKIIDLGAWIKIIEKDKIE